MRRPLLNLPNIGFGSALAVLMAITVFSYEITRSVAKEAEARHNGSVRLELLHEVLAVVVDIETGARGYVITGDPVFLEPYHSGVARMAPQVQLVHDSLVDEPRQQSGLAALEAATTKLSRQAAYVVSLKKELGDGSANREVATGRGKKMMDQIRQIVAALRREEQDQLAYHELEFQDGLRWSAFSIVVGSAFGFAAVGLATVAVNRNLRERIRLNSELRLALADNTGILDQLRATATELTRSNEELEQFAYIASHDLQEPLRKVSSFAQLLGAQYKDKLDADANEFIGYMVDGARRMQILIQNLLAFSRLGRKDKPFANTDGNAVLKQALVNLEESIEESGAVITNAPLPILLGDAVQLVQLFQNLIGNAIKFCGAEKPLIRVRAQATGLTWTFSVSDNGIGIDPQFEDRIFVIFQRLHNREEYAGTGIGLAFCKKIVERHGGRIWLKSQPSQGATFCFTIPRSAAKESLPDDQTNES